LPASALAERWLCSWHQQQLVNLHLSSGRQKKPKSFKILLSYIVKDVVKLPLNPSIHPSRHPSMDGII
jgi:hypothetical protein